MATDPESPSSENHPKNNISLWGALIPVIALIIMLAFNVHIFGEDSLAGSNQFILLMGAAVAAIVGFSQKISYSEMIDEVAKNISSITEPILILLMVGALAGTWMISGIIPTMIYYGMQVLNPTIFLAATVVICSIISLATGSSWTTSATVGIALIGIAKALGVPLGMTAGAILSGAYFGDKMSPLSDTTNLAPAMAGTDLFTHIRYMVITTVPTILITIAAFVIIGLNIDTSGAAASSGQILSTIQDAFGVNPWLFVVPALVIFLIIKKTPPLIALLAGTLLGAIFAVFFQANIIWSNGLRYEITKIPDNYKNYVEWDAKASVPSNDEFQKSGKYILQANPKISGLSFSNPVEFNLPESDKAVSQNFSQQTKILKNGEVIGTLNLSAKPTGFFTTSYIALINAITTDISIKTNNGLLGDLFSSSGMAGMLPTIWLIICAMVFGGIMDAIGALAKISRALLNLFHTTFGLFASTVVSCLALNATASDQYLAIVVPGKMFAKAYKDKGLAPENLSRTLEDSGTVTSILFPWNTGGAYHSGVLGVSTGQYLFYAFFNYLSPFVTLVVAALGYKIRELSGKDSSKKEA